MEENGRTKIVCTVGPASSSVSILSRMMTAGMDVARLNFSHGSHEEHQVLLESVRSAAKKAGKTVAILQDLQGPKIRVGELAGGIALHEGEVVTFIGGKKTGRLSHDSIPLPYDRLGREVKKGHRILLDDGLLEVQVLSVKGNTLRARVNVGGTLLSHKGANFPDSTITASAFTDKDREDLRFGIQHGVDWVCLSFVTGPEVLEDARRAIHKFSTQCDALPPLLMAKIERGQALERIDEIIDAADGVMIGRGDLGVEIPLEDVPIVQKDIIERARLSGKPVIVATQMLESMRKNPRATRAEISDVANAVFDHTDAVMLSAESATGRYPAATVQAMASVIREAEQSRFDDLGDTSAFVNCIPSSLAHLTALMAKRELIRAVVLSSSLGEFVGTIGMFRPHCPIVVVTPNEDRARQLMMYAGVYPVIADDQGGTFIPRLHALLHARLSLPKGKAVAYLTNASGKGVSFSLLPL